jgi:acyl-CoA synthetase (AMP-forming)/AMP-acid ligase II
LIGDFDDFAPANRAGGRRRCGAAKLDVHRNEQVLIMLPDGPGFVESFAGAVDQDALPLPVSPLLSAPELAAAAKAAQARLVLASPNQLATLAELTAEPTVLITGPHGPWVAALRLR